MNTFPDPPRVLDVEHARWRLDPTRSSVESQVRHFYGLVTVKGRFERYEGTLDMRSKPAVELTIEADSLDTKQQRRDKHLRSADFFDVEHYPQVRFVSDSAARPLRVDGRVIHQIALPWHWG